MSAAVASANQSAVLGLAVHLGGLTRAPMAAPDHPLPAPLTQSPTGMLSPQFEPTCASSGSSKPFPTEWTRHRRICLKAMRILREGKRRVHRVHRGSHMSQQNTKKKTKSECSECSPSLLKSPKSVSGTRPEHHAPCPPR